MEKTMKAKAIAENAVAKVRKPRGTAKGPTQVILDTDMIAKLNKIQKQLSGITGVELNRKQTVIFLINTFSQVDFSSSENKAPVKVAA